jgi:GR25 family glycosyltransferase involved in LPS biosynthesis
MMDRIDLNPAAAVNSTENRDGADSRSDSCSPQTIPVRVLNLKRSAARRLEISERLNSLGINHEFFEAIDGRALSPDELERLAPQSLLLLDRPLTAGEIGSAASHFKIIRQLAAENHEFACVMEDDAVPLSADIRLFLQPDTLKSLPEFDVLRLVSDPLRWKRPAWKVGQAHGRGIYAMARAGWGLQGVIYSRAGLHKMAAQLGAIRATTDFMLFHDCHVRGLRVVEVRPALVHHDESATDLKLQMLSATGLRPILDVAAMSSMDRLRRNLLRQRRKRMAIAGFVQVWGVGALLTRVLPWWPPGSYFR